MKLGSNKMAGERNRPAVLRWIDRLGESRLFRIVVCAFVARGQLYGGDILRPNGGTSSASSASSASSSPGANPTPVTKMVTNAQDRLARTTQALAAVRAMQTAARAAATAAGAPKNAGTYQSPGQPGQTIQLLDVTDGLAKGNGTTTTDGLVPDSGLPAASSTAGSYIMPGSWQGVGGLGQTTSSGQTTVNVTQSAQQAILNWQSFNVGKNTTLNFDQSAGGADVGNWIAFNKIGITGSPSQILGSIRAQGQVYVINPNGIIFGGSSQVNAHALVASSLPINDNLIQRGLLNNPDSQFLFSGLPLLAGSNGPTDSFTPLVSDLIALAPDSAGGTFISSRKVADPSTVSLTYLGSSTSPVALVPAIDYTSVQDATSGKVAVNLTNVGLAKVAGRQVDFSYTPAASEYGDVTVQAGATIFSPTSADHVGGRVALIGPNVTNVGTLSAPDGQVILAAGLQVAMAAHAQNDPSLRGLDVYVGQVSDSLAPIGNSAGTATNARDVDSGGKVTMGLIETTDLTATNADGTTVPLDRPGAVTMAGRTIDQLGVINSATTVSFNGRVDLLANYNAVPNSQYDATVTGSLPFVFPTGGATTGLQTTGVVTLGAGSLVQIIPSASLTDTINRTQDEGLALPSQINLQGQAIHLASDVAAGETSVPSTAQAATIEAPNAQVSLQAGSWVLRSPGTSNQISNFLFSGGQVYFDRGASIDVSGTAGAAASVAENIVNVQLRGAELADSPLQQNGLLRGQTVQVDLRVHGPWDATLNGGMGGYSWVGTPIGDASGYVALVQRTADELTTAGGTVNVRAGGSVVMQPGSMINVSGGWIDYQGGYVQTTKVISSGHIYDISQAMPNLVYDGIYTGSSTATDPKWGVSQTTTKPLPLGYYDPGYVQGGNGGRVSITAASVALDGNFAGETTSGPRQVLAFPAAGSNTIMPIPSEFSVEFGAQFIDPALSSSTNPIVLSYSPTAPNVILQSNKGLAKSSPVPDFTVDPTDAYMLPTSRQNEVDISPNLVNSDGFGFLSIDNGDDNVGNTGRTSAAAGFGRITVPASSGDGIQPVLTFGPASALSGYLNTSVSPYTTNNVAALELIAANIDIIGSITAPGGSLIFHAPDISASRSNEAQMLGEAISQSDPIRGAITFGPKAVLNVAGSVINQSDPASDPAARVPTSGGQVSLSGFQITVDAGSTIDVSGGATISGTGKVSWGTGGKISLTVADEQQFDGAQLIMPTSYTGDPGSNFALRGYSGSSGAELDMTAPLIQIGGKAENDNMILLNPGLFSLGGFATYKITGLTDSRFPMLPALLIGSSDLTQAKTLPPVTISPQVMEFQANLGDSGTSRLHAYLPDPAFQPAASLSFTAAEGNPNLPVKLVAGLVVGDNALISLTPNAAGQVGLNGDTVAVLGKVSAPGGTISVNGATDSSVIFGAGPSPLATVYLGPESTVSTAGAPDLSKDGRGYTVGSVLAGGAIKVKGNIVAEKGAVLDASGSTGTLDVSPFQASLAATSSIPTTGSTLIPTIVASNGGSISMTGGQELFSDAMLTAQAGGPTATGGTLNVQSGVYNPNGLLLLPTVTSLLLTASGPVLPISFAAKGLTAIGQVVVDTKGDPISSSVSGGANFFGGALAASSFGHGGFDWLNFGGSVEFSGAVELKADNGITLGTAGVISANTSQTSALTLNAPYVALGASFLPPAALNQPTTTFLGTFSPTYGTAGLSVTGAQLIDIGNLSMQNVGAVSLTTNSSGDIRGDGTFDLAGALTMTAGQIYPPTATTFNIAAYDYVSPTDGKTQLGSVTFNRVGTPLQVPLSAGGQLNAYASSIVQNGVLRAPLGTINLGQSSASGATAIDPITGEPFAGSQKITLSQGSVTSVSTLDLTTGKPLAVPIPYGNNLNGTSWIDPTGTDITVTDPAGRTAKQVTISAENVNDQSGSSIDIAGGGDLYAYRWVSGTGGTVDILSANVNSFAVIPGYNAGYAPYGAFNNTNIAQANLDNDPGYVSISTSGGKTVGRLNVGDSIYLDLGAGGGPETYTLLPARYALLPGGYLVTPTTKVASASVKQADGSSIVAAYRTNALDSSHVVQPLFTMWEIAPSSVVRARAQYDDYSADKFFPQSAAANNIVIPRLPVDAGQLVLAAQQTMTLQGKVDAQALINSDGTAVGFGGLVDISSPQDILIAGPNADLSSTADELVLNSGDLTNFGSESLLIGGIRTTGANGTTVTVTTNNLAVDNGPAADANGNLLLNSAGQPSKPGAPLAGSDIILVANRLVTIGPNSTVAQKGSLPNGAETLTLSDAVTLQPGEKIGFARGGIPISFSQGASFSATVSGTATNANGATQKNAAGASVALAPGSTYVFDNFDSAVGATMTLASSGGVVTMVTGDGAAIRVSSDPNAQIIRSNVSLSALAPTGGLAGTLSFASSPGALIFPGATISGGIGSLIIDSTNGTQILSNFGSTDVPDISGRSVSLASRDISVVFDNSSGTNGSLVLSPTMLQGLQKSDIGTTGITSLSLLSYSSIDVYGTGTVGGAGLPNLSLHAAQLTDRNGGAATFQATNIQVDNSPGGMLVATGSAKPVGTLTLMAMDTTGQSGTLQIGSSNTSGLVAIDLFDTVNLVAGGGVLLAGSGGIDALGADLAANAITSLNIKAPILTGTAGAQQVLTAGGALTLTSSTTAKSNLPQGGLGASLTLQGSSISAGNSIALPSGKLSLHADGDVVVGGTLDVSGQAQAFNDVEQYTGGGNISLMSDHGAVTVAGSLDVSAPLDVTKNDGISRVGSAGSVSISAIDTTAAGDGGTNGRFVVTGTLKGLGGFTDLSDNGTTPGNGGTFSLDVGSVPNSSSDPSNLDPSLQPMNTALNGGGFSLKRTIRVRSGDVVVDGSAVAHEFNLSADQGSILVAGTIDASGGEGGAINAAGMPGDAFGNHGGTINLAAAGSVVLKAGALLTVAGSDFDAAGKGGAISFEAGSYTQRPDGTYGSNAAAVVDIQQGAKIDLSIASVDGISDSSAKAAATAVAASLGKFTGTMQLGESQTAFGTGTQFSSIGNSVIGASVITLEGVQVFDLAGSGGLINSTVENAVKDNGIAFANQVDPTLFANALIHVQPGAEIVNTATANGTVSNRLVTLYQSGSTGGSSVAVTLNAGATTTIGIAGGMPAGDTMKATAPCTATYADGTTKPFAGNTTIPALSSADSQVQFLTFKNTGSRNTTGNISFSGGNTPITLAMGVGTTFATTAASAVSTQAGDIVLPATWDLSTYRFGPNNEPGILTIRSKGNLVFNFDASLSDGFISTPFAAGGLWQAPLLPAGDRSWSYRLIAGADLTGASFQDVAPLASLAASSGSVLLGLGAIAIPSVAASKGGTLSSTAIIPEYYQTIRTGTGDITIAAGRDVQLLNSIATIYTAGTQVGNPTSVQNPGDFDLPNTAYTSSTYVGQVQQFFQGSNSYVPYLAQYSLGGGNLGIFAQNDIVHELVDSATGNITEDSAKEMPTNWLYRRGYVDASGNFGVVQTQGGLQGPVNSEIASTSWWIDFSNFFEGVGALGGGNVTLKAGRNVTNVDAVVPTNARMPGKNSSGNAIAPDASKLVELGGGNLVVRAGGDIDAGVDYVERGSGLLDAGGSIRTNATRSTLSAGNLATVRSPDSTTWLPTTLFLGQGSFDVLAGGDVTLGSVANPFLLPQGVNNSYSLRTFFSTFEPDDVVRVESMQGNVVFKESSSDFQNGSLWSWYANVLSNLSANNLVSTVAGISQPWLRLTEATGGKLGSNFETPASLMPASLEATAFSGDIDLVNGLTLAPASKGTLDLLAARNINGLQAVSASTLSASTIDVSDADPARIPSVVLPQGYVTSVPISTPPVTPDFVLSNVDALFRESGATNGSNVVLQTQQTLHGPAPANSLDSGSTALHGGDLQPLRIYAAGGDISGLTLFSPKSADVIAGLDITDIGLYVQNVRASDVSVVSAGRDIIAYDPNSLLRTAATAASLQGQLPQSGDIQISGPGTLEVLAGRNLDLGAAAAQPNGTQVGITSIGNARNPFLPFEGASIMVGAGIGASSKLDVSQLDFAAFNDKYLNPAIAGSEAAQYLPELGQLMGFANDPKNPQSSNALIWTAFTTLPVEQQDLLALDVFYLVLRDAGRDHNNAQSLGFGNFNGGYEAIAALFNHRADFTDPAGTGFVDQFLNPTTGGSSAARYLPDLGKLLGDMSGNNQQIWGEFNKLNLDQQHNLALQIFSLVLDDAAQDQTQSATSALGKATLTKALAAIFSGQIWQGDIALSTRSIQTENGGNISLFAPGGGLSLGLDLGSSTQAPPGILTDHGGNISIFTNASVDVGAQRIFTLRGGNEIVWASVGNIAAGRSSKTVQSAPPTQVLVDSQSANVKTDLAGLATGGGIGVLATVAGVPAGDVDLIAPAGAIDAGDAGIRASGNLNLAARVVLNSSNIQVGGSSAGAPPPPAPPNLAPLNAASNASAAATSAAASVAKQEAASTQTQATEVPSVISVEILGYGGDEGDGDLSDPGTPGIDDDHRSVKGTL